MLFDEHLPEDLYMIRYSNGFPNYRINIQYFKDVINFPHSKTSRDINIYIYTFQPGKIGDLPLYEHIHKYLPRSSHQPILHLYLSIYLSIHLI